MCILPKGKGLPVLKGLKVDKAVVNANLHHARGAGRMTPLAYRGVGGTTEKDIVSVVVPASNADEIFEYVFEKADIYRPHGGLMFQQTLKSCTPFVLPDLPDEKD